MQCVYTRPGSQLLACAELREHLHAPHERVRFDLLRLQGLAVDDHVGQRHVFDGVRFAEPGELHAGFLADRPNVLEDHVVDVPAGLVARPDGLADP